MRKLRVFTEAFGYVQYTKVGSMFKQKAFELGYPKLLDMEKSLEASMQNASSDNPVSFSEEIILEEVKFMLTFFRDSKGFARDDIPF